MSKERGAYVLRVAAILSVIPLLILAYAEGPPVRSTGAPGDQTCTSCHAGAVNSGGGKVEVTFPASLVYTPGEKQRLRVTVTGPNSRRWGFQATARLASDERNGQAGTFTPVDAATQVLCDSGGARPAGGACPAATPVEFIEHTPSGTGSSTFVFDWTPPASNAGNVSIYVAGNAANGDGTNRGDQIYTANYTLTPTAAPTPKPAITPGGVADTFNSQPGVSSAAWISIYGSNLSSTTRTWDAAIQGSQLPTVLDGVSVSINNRPAAIYFISPTQINALAPNDPATGSGIPVTVTNSNGASEPALVSKNLYLPAFYAPFVKDGKFHVTTVQATTGEILGTPGVDPRAVRAVKPGEVVLLYGSGFGPTNPERPADQIPPVTELAARPTILFGQVPASFPGNGYLVLPGLVQFNITVPDLPDGEYQLTANLGGVVSSGKVYITVKR
jgi:uncharacterized protein (TIGR03437 family)